MAASADRDALIARTLGVPADLRLPGVLTGPGLDEVTAALHLPPGGLLLDIACGRGGYGIEAARRTGATLIGVDFSAVALDQARPLAADRLPTRPSSPSRTRAGRHLPPSTRCTESSPSPPPPDAAASHFSRPPKPPPASPPAMTAHPAVGRVLPPSTRTAWAPRARTLRGRAHPVVRRTAEPCAASALATSARARTSPPSARPLASCRAAVPCPALLRAALARAASACPALAGQGRLMPRRLALRWLASAALACAALCWPALRGLACAARVGLRRVGLRRVGLRRVGLRRVGLRRGGRRVLTCAAFGLRRGGLRRAGRRGARPGSAVACRRRRAGPRLRGPVATGR
ncbi:class I SAM-dependent methyltransferase [Dactylosporangium matsuzakiense]|uniref:class I SAM-dependent methyltransferase n=1 Tax=Dactylosporangium matsuzakiense TaxID=53360 RepID=UPI0034D95FDF